LHRHRAALLATLSFLTFSIGHGAAAQTPPAPAPDAGAPASPAPAEVPGEAPAPAKKLPRPHRKPLPIPHAQAPNPGDTIQAIKVVGNQRIEEGTILSYMLVQPGDSFTGDRVDRSLRTLYSTGLFTDVNLRREGNALVVHVLENPLVNNINFEGNHNVKEEDLRKELELRPRAVFTARMAEKDRQRLLDVYASKGRFAATVEPFIVRLPQNRVNVVFRIVEGPETSISRVVFIGNHAFPESRLRGVIDSREERWYKFFSSADQFNPDRVNYDKELLRRFYLSKGYADFNVTNLNAELSPDRKAFFVTFQIDEGERYTVGKVDLRSEVPKLDAQQYRNLVAIEPGAFYNGDLVEKTVDIIETRLRKDGHPFVKVNPRIARNRKTHTIDLVFDLVESQHVYVERIDITGNSVTRDNVIRREFRFAEGDPLDQTLIRQTKTRLNDLGYFGDVKITPEPGSAPDKAIIDTEVVQKANGELSLGGGYSTDAGILGQAGLKQRDLIGTGIEAGINGTIAARESQVDLSATDPYFLERNLVAGGDIFFLNNNNLNITDYQETRYGTTLRLGYAYNDHVSQAWTYSVIDRDVSDIQEFASQYVLDEAGYSLLSMIGQTMTFDYRDSRINAHSGFVIRAGTDLAGLGGDEHFVRAKLDGTYYIPLEAFTGDPAWNIAVSGGGGYLYNLQSSERIIDRFFLGGDNLIGFLDQGAGPHSVAYSTCFLSAQTLKTAKDVGCPSDEIYYHGSDSLGGNTIYTQKTTLNFPLPVSKDFGLSGRVFENMGGLYGLNVPPNALTDCLANSAHNKRGQAVDDHGNVITQCYYNSSSPRLAVGFGVSWASPFGLINIDIGIPLLKEPYDQTQILRFGFGTRFQ
jgi:outer membrane protein insertion porin family